MVSAPGGCPESAWRGGSPTGHHQDIPGGHHVARGELLEDYPRGAGQGIHLHQVSRESHAIDEAVGIVIGCVGVACFVAVLIAPAEDYVGLIPSPCKYAVTPSPLKSPAATDMPT